ncbi:PrsW family glutamic-type intramembrane protease [Tautonia rosea]|uniref:PrsW family glutamic-type intramembrane protease n=1 Tax=Tautonia rosea TaxID=2728037 RepID=UPI001473063F|nr:PrsW family glutamic-type intramembrane protease [Tautonia rosea]
MGGHGLQINGFSFTTAVMIAAVVAIGISWLIRRNVPRWLVLGLFVGGGLASFVLTGMFNRLLLPVEAALAGKPGSVQSGIVEVILTAALSEQTARLAIILLAAVAFRDWVGSEAALCCALIGLGFAAIENAMFALLSEGPGEVLVSRSVATLTHGAMGLIMGFFVGRAIGTDRIRVRPLIFALIVPFVIHALYDVGVVLLEHQEFPEISDEPSASELRALGAPLGILGAGFLLWITMMVWAVRILRAQRRSVGCRSEATVAQHASQGVITPSDAEK